MFLLKREILDVDMHNTMKAGTGVMMAEMPISQGMPKIASKPSEARKRHGIDSCSQPSGGTKPADTLISHFWPPDLRQ